jgi:hypothetical protein
MARRYEENQQRLREQMADPEQRERDFQARLQALRDGSPDFARVLRIDAAAEEKLLRLLVDEQLSKQFQPNPFTGLGPRGLAVMAEEGKSAVEKEAFEYDEKIRAITGIIGAARLDAYLDYTRTRDARQQVERFHGGLPAPLALSDERKDALAWVIADEEEQRSQLMPVRAPLLSVLAGSRLGPSILAPGIVGPSTVRPALVPTASDAEVQRRMQLYNLRNSQLLLGTTEAANQRILEKLAEFLSREQLAEYARLQDAGIARMRERSEELRVALGLGPEEELPTDTPQPQLEVPAPAGNTELRMRVRINGLEVTKTLTSRGGRSVRFTGPQALTVEVLPSLTAPNTLKVDVRFYESVRRGRRLVGQSASYQLLGPAPARPLVAMVGAPSGSQSLLRGRKAYLYDWSVSARRL